MNAGGSGLGRLLRSRPGAESVDASALQAFFTASGEAPAQRKARCLRTTRYSADYSKRLADCLTDFITHLVDNDITVDERDLALRNVH